MAVSVRMSWYESAGLPAGFSARSASGVLYNVEEASATGRVDA